MVKLSKMVLEKCPDIKIVLSGYRCGAMFMTNSPKADQFLVRVPCKSTKLSGNSGATQPRLLPQLHSATL